MKRIRRDHGWMRDFNIFTQDEKKIETFTSGSKVAQIF